VVRVNDKDNVMARAISLDVVETANADIVAVNDIAEKNAFDASSVVIVAKAAAIANAVNRASSFVKDVVAVAVNAIGEKNAIAADTVNTMTELANFEAAKAHLPTRSHPHIFSRIL